MEETEDTLVQDVSAILLISANASALAEFYSEVLGLPLNDEVHEGAPLHYACDLEGVHFAMHPAEGWPGRSIADSRSPVIALSVNSAARAAARLEAAGISANGPHDHGFAMVVSFRDPDGNHLEMLESK